MKRQINLLPFRWQIIGWIVIGLSFVLSPIVSVIALTNAMNQPEFAFPAAFNYSTLFGQTLATIGLAFVVFSQERQEDEFTMSERAQSLMLAASIVFIWFAIRSLIRDFSLFHEMRMLDTGKTERLSQKLLGSQAFFPKAMTIAWIYIVIFRIKMLTTIRSMRDEK